MPQRFDPVKQRSCEFIILGRIFLEKNQAVKRWTFVCVVVLVVLDRGILLISADDSKPAALPAASAPNRFIPAWPRGAVFYQVFPERFRNGDQKNDPVHDSLEFPDVVPTTWQISPWGGDWYARAPWEVSMGVRFYDDGVFHRRYGGDLQGVIDKLDYLRDLGVNCLYFNPVFYARSLHKYDGSSFHHIDPYFGPSPMDDFAQMTTESSDPASWKWTEADRLFLKLIQEAHKRGMRILIDGVFNHTGRDFFAFADLRKNQQESSYVNWYTVEKWDDPKTPASEFRYKCWWGVDTLPEFADAADHSDLHPGPREYLFNITRRWMDPNGDGNPEDGIDGWRLDVANEVPDRFWQEWNRVVRDINPNAYTVAEIWDDASAYLDRCNFSASMNYHGFAFLVKGFLIDTTMSSFDFVKSIEERRVSLGGQRAPVMQNLIDSHDTDRLASMIVNAPRFVPDPSDPEKQLRYRQPNRFDYDVGEHVSPRHDPTYVVRKPNAEERAVQRLVAMFQMTYVGAPMVYYGTEAGMWGGDDPDDRMPMLWNDIRFEPQRSDPRPGMSRPSDELQFDSELHAYYRNLIRLRTDSSALQSGDIEFLPLPSHSQCIVFVRSDDQEQYLVVINRNREPLSATIELSGKHTAATPLVVANGLPSGQKTRSQDIQLELQENRMKLKLPGVSGAVIRLD